VPIHPKGLPPHPEPDQIFGRPLPLISLMQPWVRSHKRTREPIHFGRTGENRFDDPAQDFGVLYASADIRGAFVETFLRNRTDRFITRTEIGSRLLAEILFPEPLRLVDLTESGLVRMGADSRLHTGDYSVSQRWARALHWHRDQPDGILYCSRLDPSCRCVAIFDGRPARPAASFSNLGSLTDLHHRPLLGQLLDLYDFKLLDI